MYIPAAFREERMERLAQLMREHPLATLVTLGAGGLIASHVPLVHEPCPDTRGILHGHLSRANQQWRDLRPDVEALAIFQGPQAYIRPAWYATKRDHGRVVPTWNYAVVHAYGTLEVYTEPGRLRKHLERLTAARESGFAEPWTPGDAPAEFVEGLLKSIVGIDIRIARLEGKWKMSQNRPPEDRAGVIEALEGGGDPQGTVVARLVREYAP